jgi:hypothetical protein
MLRALIRRYAHINRRLEEGASGAKIFAFDLNERDALHWAIELCIKDVQQFPANVDPAKIQALVTNWRNLVTVTPMPGELEAMADENRKDPPTPDTSASS